MIKNQNRQTEKPYTPKQEWFKKQSPERQWIIMKPFLDIFGKTVSEKMKILPSLSAISATLLIVASLRPDLIRIGSVSIKIILSILLPIIPLSLIIYIFDKEKAAIEAVRHAEGYQKNFGNSYTKNRSWWDKSKEKLTNSKIWDRVAAESSICVAVIYLVIISYLLYAMWK